MDLPDIARLLQEDLFLETPISVETLQTVNDFILRWMIYEGRLYESDFKSDKLIKLVNDGVISLTHLSEYWAYFRDRYMGSETDLNETFEQLKYRNAGGDQATLRAILTHPAPTDEQRTTALLLIVARLRNNLFHGIKKVAVLNLQRENLAMAVRVLEDVLRHVHLTHKMAKFPRD